MIPDPNWVAAQIAQAIAQIGSNVVLPNGVTLRAINITNEREIQKVVREEGEPVRPITTVFQFNASAHGIVTKGTRLVTVDGSFVVDMLHTEVLNNVVLYVAAGCGAQG